MGNGHVTSVGAHTFTATNDEVLGRAAKSTADDEFALLLTAETAHDRGRFHIDELDLTLSQVHKHMS